MMSQENQLTYLDLGFDMFMNRKAIFPSFTDANEFDAFMELGERTVKTSKLADFSVKNSKIDDASITTAKIADAQITNAKIGDAEIDNAKISDLSAEKINAGIITGRTLRTAEPATGAGRSVVIEGGSNKDVKFYNDETLMGYIGGYIESSSGEDSFLKLFAQSGRFLRLLASKIEVNGNFVPATSVDDPTLGSAGQKWKEIHVETVVEGDSAFTDEKCPICDKEFVVGDTISHYIHKIEKNDLEKVHYSIPVHYDCIKLNIKKSKNDIKKSITEKEAILEVAKSKRKTEQIEADRIENEKRLKKWLKKCQINVII